MLLIHHIWLHGPMIKISRGVELNPGPNQKQDQSLSICYCNLNSIPAHDFQKLESLQCYISSNRVSILCLSETFLNSDLSWDGGNLQLLGFNLIRTDHPSNIKRGRICIYYQDFLPLKLINIQYPNKCITIKIKTGDKICNFVSLFRSPNQSKDDFEKFCDNFELTLDVILTTNPFLIAAIGDFNVNFNDWYTRDTTTFEGSKIEATTFQFRLQPIINEPTQSQEKFASCIDRIFTPQQSWVTNLVSTSLFTKICYHQIVFAQFNHKIHYPPPYKREVRHFKKVNTDHMKRTINPFMHNVVKWPSIL